MTKITKRNSKKAPAMYSLIVLSFSVALSKDSNSEVTQEITKQKNAAVTSNNNKIIIIIPILSI